MIKYDIGNYRFKGACNIWYKKMNKIKSTEGCNGMRVVMTFIKAKNNNIITKI